MNRQQLDRFLTSATPRATFLYGESPFWIEYYSSKIASKITDAENTSRFYFGEYQYAQVFDLLSQSSLFGDSALVILKLDKKLSKKEIQAFLKAIEGNRSNSLIIEFYRSDSRSAGEYARDFKEMAGVFKGDGVVEVRFFEPNLSECQMLLAQKAKELGLQIDMRNLMFLLNMQNGDIAIALNELEKFIYLNRPVSEKDINELCSGIGSVEFEDLLNALLGRKEVLGIYARLEEEGLDEMGLLSAMGNYFYRLFMFFAYIRSHGKVDAKEILGYAPPHFVVEKFVREAMSLREKQYKEIFECLIEWRIKIFSGGGKVSNAIVALHKLQAILG